MRLDPSESPRLEPRHVDHACMVASFHVHDPFHLAAHQSSHFTELLSSNISHASWCDILLLLLLAFQTYLAYSEWVDITAVLKCFTVVVDMCD